VVNIQDFLQLMLESSASDLHITQDSPPLIRVHGALRPLSYPPLTAADTRTLCYSILTEAQKKKFEEDSELDFSFAAKGVCRFRGNLYLQKGAVGGAFRAIPYEIPPLDKLGLPRSVIELAELPRGLVLVTGPTGSGKSTTLAAVIDKINQTRPEHIITIEDPIEFVHDHKRAMVNQREVYADTHGFAGALKHVLRQDPDIVLIGEMRDLETIAAALVVAETGHLVFSTLHTNDAAGAVSRILEMGVEDYLLASSLLGVLAQRLVRKVCARCRQPVPAGEALLGATKSAAERFATVAAHGPNGASVYRAVGCEECSGTGYRGRSGIYELLLIDESIRELVLKHASADIVRNAATAKGMRTLRDDGWLKVREGVTTVAEVLRVTQEE